MNPRNVLIIGETPVTICLTYALTSFFWDVTYYNIDDWDIQREWKITINKREVICRVKEVILEISNRFQRYDLIIFNEKYYDSFLVNFSTFQQLIKKDTIVLVDCTECPWLFDYVNRKLKRNLVLAVHTEIDCRRLVSNCKVFKVLDGSDKCINIGLMTTNSVKPTIDLQQLRKVLPHSLLGKLTEACKTCGFELFILNPVLFKHLSKVAWKNVMSIVCFQALSISFNEPEPSSLWKGSWSGRFIANCFQEILSICQMLRLDIFVDPETPASLELLQMLLVSEESGYMRLKSEKQRGFRHLEFNKSYYNYVNNLEVPIINTIDALVILAARLNLGVPTLKLVLEQVKVMVGNRTDKLGFFPPERNMMRYPPFNPPPEPYPPINFTGSPIIMMSYQPKPVQDDNESVVSVDPAVKELVQEYGMAGGDTESFYDTQQHPQPQTSSSNQGQTGQTGQTGRHVQQTYKFKPPGTSRFRLNQRPSSGQLPQQYGHQPPQQYGQPSAQYGRQHSPQYYPQPTQPMQYPMHPPPPSPRHPPLPQQSYEVARLDGVPEGFYYQSSSASTPPPMKRPASFHRLQPNLNRNTPVDQLRQSHQNILDVTNGCRTFGSSSSRYGRYDTTTTLMNQTNSKGKKPSSNGSKK